ncbi:MAG: hypothetical protein ABL901_06700 [Hyphomicrobiaceae bacterium]
MSDQLHLEPALEATPGPAARPPAAALHILSSPIYFASALCVADGLLLAIKILTQAPLAVWFALHIALIATATYAAWRHRALLPDLTTLALALTSALIAGPVGALLAALALQRLAREPSHPKLLAAWYDRIALAADIDSATGLYNTVAMGRALETSTSPPRVFDEVMTQGSLADRQTALGLIARQFQPSYAPALRHALVSPEPVIRVQAAAVAVKVRAELKTTLAVALARAQAGPLTPAEAAALAVELRAMVRSGLLEDDDRDRGEAAARKLVAVAVDELMAARNLTGEIAPSAQALIETELLRRGNFQVFRDQRARAARIKGGTHV